MTSTRAALIGPGVMGQAVLGSIVSALGAEQVSIAGSGSPRAQQVAERHGVRAAASSADAVAGADVVVLAVKPTQVASVCADIADALAPGTLVVSVAAGIATAFLADRLPADTRVVRVMPNTPALIGRGVAAISGGTGATEQDLDLVARLLAGTGTTVVVPEDQQDVVTAISGSGPAYLFYLVEAMRDAGVEGGLPAELALTLATRTVAGAAALAVGSAEDPAELRRHVTSPGGTTEAATTELDTPVERSVREAVVSAARRAWQRSAELGQG